MNKKKKQNTQTKTRPSLFLLAVSLGLIFTIAWLKWKDTQHTSPNADLYLRLVEMRLTYLELYGLNPTADDFSDEFNANLSKLQEQHTETQAFINQNSGTPTDTTKKALDIITRQGEVIGRVDGLFSEFGRLFSPVYKIPHQEPSNLLPKDEIKENVLTLSQDILSISSYINHNPHYSSLNEHFAHITSLIDLTNSELEKDSDEIPAGTLFTLLEAVNEVRNELYGYIKESFETDEALQVLTDLTNLILETRADVITLGQ